ncbi:MAG: hypothetical protein U0Q11_00315 [Vicinamibacterales bacterium]
MRRSWKLAGTVAAGLSVFVIGAGAQTPSSPTGPIRQITGDSYVYAVRQDGSVVGWGRPDASGGLIPDGRNAGLPRVLELPGKVRQIAATNNTALALMDDGSVYGWGLNDSGMFGKGVGSSRTPENPMRTAVPIKLTLPNDIVQFSAAGSHAVAVRKSGIVITWGDRPDGNGPVQLAGLADVVKVVAAMDHNLALTRGGLVFAWGENNNGQIGAPMESTRRSETPVQVQGLDHVVDIAADGTTNFGFSGAVKDDGTVWMWGSDQSATMGDGVFWGNNGPSPENHDKPVAVKGVTGAKSIAVGHGHVAVILGDRTLRMWGHDGWGQIGVGTHGFYQPLPKKPAIADIAAVWTVANSTYAMKGDGTMWWWGVGPTVNNVPPLGKDQWVPTQLQLPN